MQPPQGGTTIGQQFSLTQRPAAELPRPVIAEPAAAPAGQRASQPKLRAVELLWAAEDAEQRARRAPAVAGAFEPAAAAEDAAERKDASPRAVHRALARLAPADDIEKALWDAVDEDGVLSPPVVLVSGELELLFDDAELVKALVPLLRPFAEGDGELGERLDSAAGTAERLPDASRLVARELAALRRLWDEREVPVPMADLEAEARRILLARRRLRSIDIFEGQHLVALLRTEAHDDPLPVYLPAAARGRLPLESRFDARLLVQLFPRQAADEPCPLAAAALAVARVVRP